jgi:hypothetical protein
VAAFIKTPRERRYLPFDLSPQISEGADLTTLQGFASRKVTLTTTLTAQLNPEDATATLDDDPGVGSFLVVDPDNASLEETFKVTAVTPSGGNFICAIIPTAEQLHISTATVEYEPGVSPTLLDDDTPTAVGFVAPFFIEEGAHSQTYRVSVIGTCDNGELVEDEQDITVTELTPTSTITKQPSEMYDVLIGFSDWTAKYVTTVSSAIAFVSRMSTTNTTVNGTNSAGSTTLNLNASPAVGALLIVNSGQPNQEHLLVSAVAGGTPFPCTVSPLQFTHSNAEPVTVQPGVSARVLVSSTATIVGGTDARFRIRRGASGQTYFWAVVATLADAQICQKSILLTITEE